jgi:hypothetical protein
MGDFALSYLREIWLEIQESHRGLALCFVSGLFFRVEPFFPFLDIL